MRTAIRVACAGYALALVLPLYGCRSADVPTVAPVGQTPIAKRAERIPAPPESTSVAGVDDEAGDGRPHTVRLDTSARPAQRPAKPVTYVSLTAEEIPSPKSTLTAQPTNHLEIDWLVAEVLARNPDIRSAIAAWQAAAQRYPQDISLEDPMLGLMLGPGSWGSDEVTSAYAVEASQKLPWPGKRQLRGNIARAQANAAYFDTGEQRLRIAEATRVAFAQYYLAHRQLDVLTTSTDLLSNFREIAQRRYEAASVEQQDVLLADVELADLERRRLELNRMEQVARARLNTLLLVTPDSPLPAPPAELGTESGIPSVDELRLQAISQRPELAAQAARIRAERYSIQLAQKEFYPDMELFGRYDAFWQEDPLRAMVGVNLNVPIYKEKRWAAIREASARVAQQQATLDSQINEIAFQVEQAYRRVEESRQSLKVYEDRILPTAQHSVESARASYTSGRLDFLRLIESQRQLLTLQDRYYETVAEYYQRRAELERVVGNRVMATEMQ